jgi:hypothetical protein
VPARRGVARPDGRSGLVKPVLSMCIAWLWCQRSRVGRGAARGEASQPARRARWVSGTQASTTGATDFPGRRRTSAGRADPSGKTPQSPFHPIGVHAVGAVSARRPARPTIDMYPEERYPDCVSWCDIQSCQMIPPGVRPGLSGASDDPTACLRLSRQQSVRTPGRSTGLWRPETWRDGDDRRL